MTQTVRAIAAAVAAGTRSAREVMVEMLSAATSYDAVQPQAWISRHPDSRLLALAEEVDAAITAGAQLPLAGVPFAVKDNIDVAGLPTTAGSPAFAYHPTQSAAVVARLEAAGAICVGKTNLDQFATGLNGTRTPYGIPACVFNHAYISGGSSSGSGVLVGAGIVPFALGTDTAGSGRVPAAVNGCVGFKPSLGRWSSRGMLPACRSLDCISVFTRDVGDAELIDRVARGFDQADPFSQDRPDVPSPDRPPVIAVPFDHQLEFFGDTESARLFAEARQRCQALGWSPVEVDISALLEAGKLLYGGPWVAERTAAVGDFLETNPDGVHPVVASIVKGGARHDAVDTFNGLYRLKALARDAEAIWAAADVLLLPTTPTVYSIAEMLRQPVALNNRLGHYTAAINLLDLAAIALPAGYRANATGFGISLIGPAATDGLLFDLGMQFFETGDTARPALDTASRDSVKLAVVGAHLEGMPLHRELLDRSAEFVGRTHTAPIYALYAIANSSPPKPALIHVGAGGASIEVEVYALDAAAFGSFVANVPPPLAIGTVQLSDGQHVKGFVAEPRAMDGARDISEFGGWRRYIRHLQSAPSK